MSQTKYKRFYELMEEQNTALFDKFQKIHDEFAAEKLKKTDDFHNIGREVMDIMRFWERKLCQGMERGNNGVYSQKVSEKFWAHIKIRFPEIDKVGLVKK